VVEEEVEPIELEEPEESKGLPPPESQ